MSFSSLFCIMQFKRWGKGCLIFSMLACLFVSPANAAEFVHGMAMHGSPKYKADYSHLEYANPDSPKGGELRLASQGSFDSLNPFILKGNAVADISGLVYQTLLESTKDEAFSEYGLIAEAMEVAEDSSWVVFKLRPEAKWSDGEAITAEDVVFSFDYLISKGHPAYKAYYSHVKGVMIYGENQVKFIFDMKGNRELPLIVGQMPILPQHYWLDKDFEKDTTSMPLGSGPYKVKEVDMGRKIVFERVKDWWAKDLPINKGRYNFDIISNDFFRDETVLLQALFAGTYDVRHENIAKAWEVEYNVPAVKEGLLKKIHLKHNLTSGMQGWVFNLRKDIFQDIKTRKALNYAFDFEWSNKQFAYGSYMRTDSYFVNSELASKGLPTGRELEILEQFKDSLPQELFTQEFMLPKTSGSGRDMRKNLKIAKDLLEEAGWKLGDSGLLEKDGQEFKFEIMLYSPAFKRWFNPFIANLKKLGIEANLRLVDVAQYQKRFQTFDFDMVVQTFPQSLSPGNEQYDLWGSSKADIEGSKNIIGIKNPVIDKLIELVVSAPSREELIYRTNALDRVLLWNYYLIPNWYIDYYRIAYWDKFGMPKKSPEYGLAIEDTWWYDEAKADNIANKVKN